MSQKFLPQITTDGKLYENYKDLIAPFRNQIVKHIVERKLRKRKSKGFVKGKLLKKGEIVLINYICYIKARGFNMEKLF